MPRLMLLSYSLVQRPMTQYGWAASQPHSDFDAGDEDADREPSSQAILLLMQKLKHGDAVSVWEVGGVEQTQTLVEQRRLTQKRVGDADRGADKLIPVSPGTEQQVNKHVNRQSLYCLRKQRKGALFRHCSNSKVNKTKCPNVPKKFQWFCAIHQKQN